MSREDGRCPFCNNPLHPFSSICPSCGRNILQTYIEDKIQQRPPSIALTPRNLVIGGVIVLLVAIVPSIVLLSLSRSGNQPTPIVKTIVVHDHLPTQMPTIVPTQQPSTPIPPTPTVVPEIEAWTGTIQIDTSNWVSTYYAELHVTNIGQTASFQGTWCEDLTDQKDVYGHSVCTNSMSISGSWVAFSKLGAGLQADINHDYPNTTHDPIILWSGQAGTGQGNLCQDCRYYASIQNNKLNGLVYWANGEGPHGKFNFILQGSGVSKLGS